MRSQQMKIRWMLATATAALLTAAIAPMAAAGPIAGSQAQADPVAGEGFIPGVTDSGTGVLRELEQRRRDREPFIPGVTDSTTGVLRELERRSIERERLAAATDAASGFGWDESEVGLATALGTALVAAAALGLVIRGRQRPLAT